MQYKNLKTKIIDSSCYITIDREEKRNALDNNTIEEIQNVLMEMEEEDNIDLIIFNGAGKKSFLSGAEVGSLKTRSSISTVFNNRLNNLFTYIEYYPKVTIAMIDGYALGGGCELALACDLRIASTTSEFGFPETSISIIPGAGGTYKLSNFIGKGRAKELILTGRIINAKEAEDIGLVNRVVESEVLEGETEEIIKSIKKRGPLASQFAKLSINYGHNIDSNTANVIEKLSQSVLFSTEDKEEGINAFLEKRTPNFRKR